MRSLLVMLMVIAGQANTLMAHDLDWKNLLIASLKLRQGLDYDANVDSYMEAFRPDVWKRYRNDEFEMVGKRKETMELMKQAIAGFSLQETFLVRTSTEFGNYEFDSKSFPIVGWSESSYFYDSSYPHGSFPSSMSLFLSNPKAVSRIVMDEAQAKEFVRNRKNSSGNINRSLYVVLQLRIVKAKSDSGQLLAEIVSCMVYSDERYTKLIHEFDMVKATASKDAASKPKTAPKSNP